MSTLLEKIKKHEAQVAVIGIGYVGLPLATEMARAGFRTVGYDKSEEKVRMVNAGRSYIKDIHDQDLQPLLAEGRLRASTDPGVLATADVVVICVPTPLNKTKEPDNSFIVAAADDLFRGLHKDMLIILESTTFPGFTREVLLPKLQESGLKAGQDFFLCFSPERVDPGNARYHTRNTPKVVGGTTPRCLEAITAMYGEVLEHLVPVSSTDAAEMVKLLENTFRAVNIGLVNEVAIMAQKLGIDTWEIIDAAATKPFGFMPFYPGPGLGGHCIPVDPLYLSWKLKTLKYEARFIELADDINTHMPHVVVELVADALNADRKSVNGSRVLILGVAYKRDIEDVRESPALDVIELLQGKGAEVSYHDPYAATLRIGEHVLHSKPIDGNGLEGYDAVVIVTDHSSVDYGKVVREARLVIDTRNATRKVRGEARGRVIGL
ncbi:MAG: nucleotide sugar dehydrogenase [Myxococcales bacterium]|nr:nucleotide sugar dehydrogenase [Myxococcales bacterium]